MTNSKHVRFSSLFSSLFSIHFRIDGARLVTKLSTSNCEDKNHKPIAQLSQFLTEHENCGHEVVRKINRGRLVYETKSGKIEIRSNISRICPILLSY